MSLLAATDIHNLVLGISDPLRQTHLTCSGLDGTPECGPRIDQDFDTDEDFLTGSHLNDETDNRRCFEAIVSEAPVQLFSNSGSVQEVAKRIPDSQWYRILLEYWIEDEDSMLPLVRGVLGLRCYDMRMLNTYSVPHSREILPGLMVIDCFSRQVIAAEPGCQYVALSYVWGEVASRGEDEKFEPDLHKFHLPQTIQDAMNVVRAIGMRFLWVDRYCIDRNEPGPKHYMISHMDAIYDAAYLTIIAASGRDGNHGLPSVSRSYNTRDGHNIPPWNGVVHSKLPYARLKQIESSTWSTRGWTFQEGLLSRRRLIFTDRDATLRYGGEDSVRANHGIFAHINEYSRRHLSRQSDLLDAFLGVFRAYERLQPPAMHVSGVPFLPNSKGNISQPGYGLLWRSDRECPLRRNEGLPSWTWAGWSGWSDLNVDPWDFTSRFHMFGPYSWLINSVRDGARPWGPSDISLKVLLGEQLTDISDYFRAKQTLPTNNSVEPAPILYLNAWSTTINVSVELSVLLEGGDMGRAIVTFDSTVESLCNTGSHVNGRWRFEWTAAIIFWGVSDAHAPRLRTQSLLLERVKGNTFCRVGVLETDWLKADLDEYGHMAAFGRTFARTRMRIV